MTATCVGLLMAVMGYWCGWRDRKDRGRKQPHPLKAPSTLPLLAPYRESYYGPPAVSSDSKLELLNEREKMRLDMTVEKMSHARLQDMYDTVTDMLLNPECYGREACQNGIRTDIIASSQLDKFGKRRLKNIMTKRSYEDWANSLESNRVDDMELVTEYRFGSRCTYARKKKKAQQLPAGPGKVYDDDVWV